MKATTRCQSGQVSSSSSSRTTLTDLNAQARCSSGTVSNNNSRFGLLVGKLRGQDSPLANWSGKTGTREKSNGRGSRRIHSSMPTSKTNRRMQVARKPRHPTFTTPHPRSRPPMALGTRNRHPSIHGIKLTVTNKLMPLAVRTSNAKGLKLLRINVKVLIILEKTRSESDVSPEIYVKTC